MWLPVTVSERHVFGVVVLGVERDSLSSRVRDGEAEIGWH